MMFKTREMQLHSKVASIQCLWATESKKTEDFWMWTEERLQMFVACELSRPQNNPSFKLYRY